MLVNKTWWNILLALLLLGLILAAADLLIPTVSVLLLIFCGLLFGIFISGIASFLSRLTPLRYLWSYIAVVATLIITVAGGLYFLGWRIAGQASRLWSELRTVWEQEISRLMERSWVQDHLPDQQELRETLLSGDVFPQMMTVGQWLENKGQPPIIDKPSRLRYTYPHAQTRTYRGGGTAAPHHPAR